MSSYSRASRNSWTSVFEDPRQSSVAPASAASAFRARVCNELGSGESPIASHPQHARERGTERRLPQVFGGRMPPRTLVLHGDVLDDRSALPGEVVRELRVEPTNRIEAIEQVRPATSDLAGREPVGPAPTRCQLVLNFVEAERAANRDQAIQGRARVE